MAYEFRLPDIGEGLAEAEIVRWRVAVGDPIGLDEPLVELETDKALVEIPSPRAGVVLRHGGDEGTVLAVGEILAVIGEEGEVVGEADGKAEAAPIIGTLATEAEMIPTRSQTPASGTKPQALPVVRKLAAELGVELGTVVGTGQGGRITREDVIAASEVNGDSSGSERVPLTRLRRTIADHMTRSWQEIPHVTTYDALEAGVLLEARRTAAEDHGDKVPLEAIVVKAVLPTLVEFPDFNATFDGDAVIRHNRYDIGIAVDTEEGLLVAVVKGADKLDTGSLSVEILRLADAAKARTLTPDEVTGGTFTVSNIGAVGGGYGTPIIPYGTTAILSVGRAADQPVVRAGAIEIAPVMPLSLSYDHRVIDGGVGRRFMAALIERLSEPEALR